MTKRRMELGEARKSHRGEVTLNEMWPYIMRHMLESLEAKGRIKHRAAEVEELIHQLIGNERADEISPSCNWTELDVEKMHLDFNERVPLLISLGSVFTVDETVLAYFGLDARIMDILRLFPKKPHDFGLLGYRASVRIIVAILPITPGQNYTPTSAALAIMDLLADAVRHVPHYVMDSAFATEELFSEVQWREVAVSLSLKENRTDGFGPLYELVTEDLPLGETRTSAVNNVVIQAQKKKIRQLQVAGRRHRASACRAPH